MRVCQILVKQGCVEEDSIEKALQIQMDSKKEIGAILVDMGAIRESDLGEALSFQSDLRSERFTDKVGFLEAIEPFRALTTADLQDISHTMEWNSYAPGEFILKEGDPVTNFSVVKNGLAKIWVEQNGGETVFGFLGEGEFCGATALLSDGISPSNVVAIEPTLCLSQSSESFARTIEKYPWLVNYFNGLFVSQTNKILTRLLTTGTGTISQVEPFLYSKQVKDLVSPIQVFCEGAVTLREAARMLVARNGHTVIVVDEAGALAGTVGLKRLVEASLVEGMDFNLALNAIVENDYPVIGSDKFFFDALHEMMKKGTDMVIVKNMDRTIGVLTSLDLLKFRGREVLSLIRNIDNAQGFSELDAARQDVEQVLRTLMTDGAVASHACKIVSELYDKITGKVIQLVEEELGPPPSPYTWLGLGSEGRKEQTLLTDQDNAILFDEFHYSRKVEGVGEYFMTLAERVVHGLDECGFPLCKGNIMATNPRYHGNLPSWKERVLEWIAKDAVEGKDLLDIYTFLDLRGVYGSDLLEGALRSLMMAAIRENPVCLRALAEPIVQVPIPLGFFKNFIVEKNGQYKNTVNIKVHGLLPLTTCTKLLALQNGIAETNTLGRLRLLMEADVISAEQEESMERAFETLLTLKIHSNLNNLDKGRDFSNNINPSTLSVKQKQLLKEAFLSVSQLQKITKDELKVMD